MGSLFMAVIVDFDAKMDGQILDCTLDLNAILPELMERYSPVVVVRALATHVGGGLKAFMESGICTEEQVISVLRRLLQLVLEDSYPEPRTSHGL
jgi:hypothetical protein